MTIAQNIDAKNAADEVHRLASGEALQFKDGAALRFWSRLLENVCAVLPPDYHPTKVVKSPYPPMSRQEAHDWGQNTQMPFGKHMGDRVDSVPLEYLLWLDEQPDFRRQLHQYLASPRVQEEISRMGD